MILHSWSMVHSMLKLSTLTVLLVHMVASITVVLQPATTTIHKLAILAVLTMALSLLLRSSTFAPMSTSGLRIKLPVMSKLHQPSLGN